MSARPQFMDRAAATAWVPRVYPPALCRLTRYALLLSTLWCVHLHTVALVSAQESGGSAKRAEAIRVPGGAVHIDGRLDEAT